MKHFSGRVAFIAGGTTGIGYALAHQFLTLGMKVVIVGCNPEHLKEAKQTLSGLGVLEVLQADVGDREQLRSAAREAIRTFGKVHVLCNNAVTPDAAGDSVYDPEFEAWDSSWRVNFGGVVNGTKIITPLILRHGEGGHIINTSSIAGIVPLPWPAAGAYMTAKTSVRSYTEALRLSLAPHGIGVSCLCPGLTRTPIHKSEELLAIAMDPMEVAKAAIEGIRTNAPYILTHAEIRDEVRENFEALDAEFALSSPVPPARKAFEDNRRRLVVELRALPVKD